MKRRPWLLSCVTISVVTSGLLLAAPLIAQTQRPLTAVVSESNSPPYAIYRGGNLSDGIAKQLLDKLARRLFVDIDYVNLPRTRVELWLQSGQADLACFLSPDWVQAPQQLRWSPILFETKQVLLRQKSRAPITAPDDVRGMRIGTLYGFEYPELNPVFDAQLAVRDNAADLAANVKRLLEGRVDVAMSVDLHERYYEISSRYPTIAADELWAAPTPVYCALSRRDPDRATQLYSAFQELVEEGEVAAIIKQFSQGGTLNLENTP